MPTLLQINVTANSGSHGKIAEEIGQLALNKGWRSVIAYGRWCQPSNSELLRVGNDIDVKEHAIESRLLDNHGLASRCATKSFVQRIKEIKPDIIHLHNIHGYFLNYRILFDYLGKVDIPVVWTLHDCWSMTGHCVHFESVGCDKWLTGCHDCKYYGTYPSSLFRDNSKQNYYLKKYYFTLPRNLTIVPVCHWLDNIVKESFLSKYPTRVIHNGIDLSVFSTQSVSPTQNEKFTILGVASNWKYDKGKAEFSKLSENESYRVIMVGVSDDIKKELPPTIQCVRRTSNVEELIKLYSMADVLVNPTQNDTYPTVNLEAIACGTPVITYKTGGSPEAVNEETGIVVERGDYEGLVKAIESIRNKTDEDRKIQRIKCRERAEQFFDKNVCYEQYLKLYQEILSEKKQ